MKLQFIIAVAALAGAASSFAQGDAHTQQPHAHTPMHGGVVTEGRDMDYELVATPARVQLYLRDHGKPAAVSQASARLTLLSGTDKQEVVLVPTGDRLEAVGSFKVGAGTKAVAVVTIGGKPATARFSLK